LRSIRGIIAAVQLELPFLRVSGAPEPPVVDPPAVDFVRVRSARRYILRVRPDGSLRVTLPRWGTRAEALRFVETERAWIARQRHKLREQAPREWHEGSAILFRGVPVPIRLEKHGDRWTAAYGDRRVILDEAACADLRSAIELDLRRAATEYLLPRLAELATELDLTYTRALVRNQRSRWGSCSRQGTISLNFRLVQLPPEVCDYILIHELMHLRQQNHSRRFWRLVEKACPGFREAERWLRKHGKALF
jgi:predicted metal-dependent hydrolase